MASLYVSQDHQEARQKKQIRNAIKLVEAPRVPLKLKLSNREKQKTVEPKINAEIALRPVTQIVGTSSHLMRRPRTVSDWAKKSSCTPLAKSSRAREIYERS